MWPQARLQAQPWWESLADAVRSARADPLAGRTRRVVLMLIFIWICNTFDLILTLLAHKVGNLIELNPLAQGFLGSHGALAALKLIPLVAATLIFFISRHRRLTEIGCWALCGVYTALAFRWLAYCMQLD